MPVVPPPAPLAFVFIELGVTVIGLALLARLAGRWGFSTIPFYLLAGLAFGRGGIAPLQFTTDFVHVGAEIGVVLLLFMLGLESGRHDLGPRLRAGLPAGLIDALLNFTPGAVAAVLLGWPPAAVVLLGGITMISSSGVVARVLGETGRVHAPDGQLVVTILVLEDLAMAAYLPLVAALLAGVGWSGALVSTFVASAAVAVVLALALRHGPRLGRALGGVSDEVLLFTALGLVLLVAGVAERVHVPASIGAFLVGVALSGPLAHRAGGLVGPLRDLFSALFFLFFGLEIDPASLPPVLGPAAALALAGIASKLATGWWAGRATGLDARTGLRAGAALVARGEFSIVIAGLGVAAGVEPALGPLAAAYVLILAVTGPLVARAWPAGAAAPRSAPR